MVAIIGSKILLKYNSQWFPGHLRLPYWLYTHSPDTDNEQVL